MGDVALRTLAPGLRVMEAPQSFMGIELGTRMAVVDTGQGSLAYSPVPVSAEAMAQVGEVKWVLAPNLFHHLHVGPWVEAGCEAWGARGLPDKRSDLAFKGVVSGNEHPFGDAIESYALTCFGMTNEVVLLHRPSKTLISSDLVFNLSPEAPLLTRLAARSVCGYPGCRTTLLERFFMKRAAAREDLEHILAWDFDRVVMAHGEVVETGGKKALRGAFSWLGV